MTTSLDLTKIRAASSVVELREATAKAIESLSIEAQLESRITAVELKVKDLEVKPI